MLHYILQTIFFQLLFLLVYELMLKKETFFNYNRAYLLITPLIAVVLPLLKFDFLAEAVPTQARIMLPEVIIGNPAPSTSNQIVIEQTSSNTSINWLLITYILGIITSLYVLIKKYNNLSYLYRFRRIAVEKDFRIIEVPNSNIACTFFNTVFLGDQLSEAEKDHILSHELVHVKQRHSLDLVFFEALKIIFWFNPLIYIYQSRIAGLHEFIADEEVVKTTEKRTYYEQLLNTAFSTQNISFINQFFNHSLIKKRIVMLQKNKSSQTSKFKFLLIIPALLLMLTYVACSDDNSPDVYKEEEARSKSEILSELKVFLENKDSLTSEEKQQFLEILQIRRELLIKEAKEKNLEVIEEQILSPPPPPAPGSAEDIQNRVDNSQYDNATSVPFAVIDKVPAFSGCDQWEGESRKDCTSSKVSKFVNQNFNTSLGKQLGLEGINRIIVQFRIDENGQVQDIKSRAPHPKLEEEAKRVISELPQFIPGEQNGRAVSVMYSLPIAFKVQ